MKKILTLSLLALFVFAIPMAFVGCRKKSGENNNILGTWVQIKTIDYYTNGNVDEWNEEDELLLTFNSNKTAVLSEESREESGSWNVDKNGLYTIIWNLYDEKTGEYWTDVWTLKFEGTELHRIESKESGTIRHEIFVKK